MGAAVPEVQVKMDRLKMDRVAAEWVWAEWAFPLGVWAEWAFPLGVWAVWEAKQVQVAKVAAAKQAVAAPAEQGGAPVVLQLIMGTPKAEVQL